MMGEREKVDRPLENTLEAYRGAWERGFEHAECDITVSSDGLLLFLCHDATWERLATPGSKPWCEKQACELTAKEVEENIKLLDGSRPASLVEVLECAKSFMPQKRQLVVELKKDKAWELCVEALCTFLKSRQDLIPFISVIMSFDHEMVSRVARWAKIESGIESFNEVSFMCLTEAPEHHKSEHNTFRSDVKSEEFVSSCSKLIEGSSLDGVYLEYQNEMLALENESLNALSKAMKVGVWNYAIHQPDGLGTWPILHSRGVSFLNSDLPRQYIKYEIQTTNL